MGLYTYEDENTGMKVQAESDAPLSGEDVDWLFGAAQKNAQQKLSDGSFEFDQDGVEKLNKDEKRRQVRRLSAQALGTSESEIDIDSGASLWERTKMDFLPDEGSRMEYLEKKYGGENVSALNVGGKTKMFYRDPKTNKMTMVDEMGASLADFTADIAGEAVTTAGAIGGAIAGTALAPGAGTGAGAVAGATAGAALGGFLTGVTQDVAAETLAGQEVDLGQIAKTRGIEAGIGVPIDLATAGAGRFLSRRLGKTATDAFADGLNDAQKRLSKAGYDVDMTTGMEIGKKAATEESVIAGKREGSGIARKLSGIRDTLGDFQRAAQGGDVDTTAAFGKTIQRIQREADELVEEVAVNDRKLANTIQKSLQRRIDRMQVEQINYDDLGTRMVGLFKRGQSKASQANDANWQNLERMATERGVSTTGKEMAKTIRDATKNLSQFKKNPEVAAKLRELDELGDEVVSFKDLRGAIEVIQDAVPSGGATGGKTAQQVASASAQALRGLRDKVVARGGKPFAKAFDDTNQYYLDNVLQFKRRGVGRTLADKMGEETLTGTQAVKSIINDPANVRDAVRAAKMEPSAESAGLIKELRDAYMNEIGLGRTGVDLTGGIRFNPEIIKELYGTGADGVFRASRGARKVEALNALNKAIKDLKITDADISPSDFARIMDSMTTNEQQAAISAVRKKLVAQQKEDALLQNVLWKKIAKGQWDAVDSPEFAKIAMRGQPKQIRQLISKMPAGSREPFRQDVTRSLFARAQGGEQMNSRGASLWNPDKMDNILRADKEKIKAAMGDGFYDDLVAANKFMKASEALTGQAADVALRASGGPQGFHFFMVGSILNAFRDRFMGWAYGSGAMKPMLRMLNKNVSDEQFAKNFKRVFSTMIGTRRGIEALAREGEQDPEFKEAAMKMIQGMNQQGVE